MAGRYDQKKRPGVPQAPGAKADQDQEQEQEQPELDVGQEQQPEQARMQNQMGNQAMIGLLSGHAGGAGGGGSVEVEQSARGKKDADKEGPQLGGDDDPDAAPITIHDLTQSWNPGIKRTKDRPAFLEPMPDDELPPEDEPFLDHIRACSDPHPLPLSSSRVVDAWVQPSEDVVRVSLTDWGRAAGQWAAPTLTWQLLSRAIAPPAPVLQDPHGRVLLSRSRVAAIANALVLASPALGGEPSVVSVALVDFCLELQARQHRIRSVQIAAEETRGKELPVARKILDAHLDGMPHGQVRSRSPGASATALSKALRDMLEFEDPMGLVPQLDPGEPPQDGDDPLGLDAVMQAFTGGAVDHEAPAYQAAIQAAERLAAAAARSRVLYAGAGVAVAETAELWSAGAPTVNLGDAMAAFDRDVAGCLQLLVEIARAAQRRSVPPHGLRTGLRRAARSLRKLRTKGESALIEIIGGILPGDPPVHADGAALPDEVAQALADGRGTDALPWIASLPPSLDRDTGLVLLQAAAGMPAPDLCEPLAEVHAAHRQRGEVLTGLAVGVVSGAALLFTGAYDRAMAVSDDLIRAGLSRRNGIWVTEGALLAMEVHHARGDTAARDRMRVRAGNAVWRMGARGPLSLLARWAPPTFDDPEVA